jgi:quinol monooxygenase YgiN
MSELLGIVRFKFHEGKVEEFKRLSARAMEIVRAQDTGTLQYDTYFNDDESEAIVIERFRDSQALIEHGEHVAGAHGADHRDGFGLGGAARRVEPGAASEDDRRRPSALQALQVDVGGSRTPRFAKLLRTIHD